MLRNYLLIAYRNLSHNKMYALINIFDLGIGLTAALFIFQYVLFEKSYDSFHKNADNIYRFIVQFIHPDTTEPPQQFATSNLAPLYKNACPEVKEIARIYKNRKDYFILSYQPENSSDAVELLEKRVYYIDASFMDMFSFPMITGDAKALQQPNTLLLSESMAKKLFGTDWQATDPIGKRLTINGERDFMVQGIFKEVPENSHIKFEALLSLTTLAEELHYDTEVRYDFPIYLEVDPNADIKQLEKKIMEVSYRTFPQMKDRGTKMVIQLQPIKEAHLHSAGFKREHEVRGSVTTVQFLLISGCFILILAWINYVNLSTAQAIKRAKEVGIRKVIGVGRRQLMVQFILEAFLLNLLSVVIALTLYQLCFPLFTSLVQKPIPMSTFVEEPHLLVGIVLVLLLGTLLTGGYSAFVLSSFKAVSTMKGKFHTSAKGVVLRKSLIVFQFIISVGLITGTFSVYEQLWFMKNYEKGFELSQKLIVRAPMITHENFDQHYESFKHELQKLPAVGQVTASFLSPGESLGKGDTWIGHKNPQEPEHLFTINMVDHDYFNTYEIEFLHGRGFSPEFPADKHTAVITEDVAIKLGYHPVASALQESFVVKMANNTKLSIIGIVKNIHLYSLQMERNGIIFLLEDKENEDFSSRFQYRYFTLDINDLAHLQESIASIEKLYQSHFPGNSFEYFFLEEYFNAQYRSEEQYSRMFSAASGLSIFIACLGLFGLSAFMVRERTKEIGIRKVLGASLQSIMLLFSKDYLLLIIMASVIALPIAYWSLNQWLENYMYRMQLSWWLFLIPVVIVILIALFTVSVQTIKAALANPTQSLRHE